MSKKLIYLISFVLMFVLASNASAAIILWDGGGDANNWNEPNNWNTNSLPLIEDDVRIDVNDANCVIDSNATCRYLYLSYTANRGPCYVYMNGGVFTIGVVATTSGQLTIGRSANGTGVFTLDDGTINIGYRLGVGMTGNGTFTMNGGGVTVYDKVEVGRNAGGNGVMYIYDGNMSFTGNSTDLEIAGSGTGTIYMEGGYVYVQDNIKLTQNATGIGRIYLNGGTLSANTLRDPAQVLGDPLIDITEGTLILRGEAGPTLAEQYIDNGWLVAYSGDGRVEIDTSSGDAVITGVELDPNCAKYIRPKRGAILDWTSTGPTLEWSQGDYAASHDVYLGTDWDDVNDANNTPGLWPEFKGNKPYATITYNQGPLSLGTTYYWRIDEVNALHPAQLWKGEVWKFTMQDYIIVDDMDEYGDSGTKPWVPGGRIYYVWRDGWFVDALMLGNKTGSQVGHWDGGNTGFSEDTIVRSGLSMPCYYENDGSDYSKPKPDYYQTGLKYYSEACAKTTGDNSLPDIDTDWTVQDVEALSLWFYGDPNNDPNILKMYVALGDSDSNGVVYYTGDINDIKKAEWQEWNIPLSSFTGVTLSDVRRIYIGFGERGNVTTKSGKGRMFFDDIRLYRARCVPAMLQPEADLDNDCDVDYDDLDIMTADWVESDYTGIGSDGVLMNFPTDNTQWVDDPCRGRCLSFDGQNDWVNLEDSEFGDFHNKTIALWVNIRSFPTTDNPYIFCFRDDDDLPGPYRVYIREHGDPNVRIQFIGDTVSDYSKDFNEVNTNTWHHLAFVLRDTGSDTCTGEFYGDGEKIHEFTGRRRHSGPARSVCIGTWNEGGVSGCIDALVDDFRVYFDALSANNIKYLAGKPGGVAPTANMLVYYEFDETTGQIAANSSTYQFNRPLLSPAELYDSEDPGKRKVNFKDYAILVADDWLKEPMLWP